MFLQIAGASDNNATDRAQLHRDQATIRQFTNTNGDINAFVDEVDHAIDEQQPHAHGRVG